MGRQKSYTWEFRLQMVQLLEKGEQNPSQISRDYHVTRSLLYHWWHLYQQQGEATFTPTQARLPPPEVERPHTVQEQVTHLERLCGKQALELDLLKEEVARLKKSLASAPVQQRHAIIERSREQMPSLSVRKLCQERIVNRAWYYRHRRPGAKAEQDQQLRLAIAGCVRPLQATAIAG